MTRAALAGLVIVALTVAAMLVLLQTTLPPWVQRLPQLLVAGAGLAAAALTLDRGDPPRPGWILLACTPAMAMLVGPTVAAEVRIAGLLAGPLIVIVANSLMVLGVMWMLRVLQRSGLAPPWTGSWRLAAGVGALGSLTVGVVVLLHAEIPAATGLDETVWIIRRVVGVSADIVVFNVALQLLRITLPMRGGTVALPYLVLALMAGLFMAVGVGLAVSTSLLQTELGITGRILDTIAWSCMGLAGLRAGPSPPIDVTRLSPAGRSRGTPARCRRPRR